MTETIYFYSQVEAWAAFSNFAPFGIEIDGKWWRTVEHYYQAQKFTDEAYQARIRKTASPKDAKALGLTRAVLLRSDWKTIKDEVMLHAVRVKFATHAECRALLLSTGNARLAEAAPNDYYWGVGADGTGQNRLGLILEQVRTELAAG